MKVCHWETEKAGTNAVDNISKDVFCIDVSQKTYKISFRTAFAFMTSRCGLMNRDFTETRLWQFEKIAAAFFMPAAIRGEVTLRII
jgi:hypothetical protein